MVYMFRLCFFFMILLSINSCGVNVPAPEKNYGYEAGDDGSIDAVEGCFLDKLQVYGLSPLPDYSNKFRFIWKSGSLQTPAYVYSIDLNASTLVSECIDYPYKEDLTIVDREFECKSNEKEKVFLSEFELASIKESFLSIPELNMPNSDFSFFSEDAMWYLEDKRAAKELKFSIGLKSHQLREFADSMKRLTKIVPAGFYLPRE